MRITAKLQFAVLALLLSVLPALAQGVRNGARAGNFDYYVLSLSWAPNWCATQGKGRGSAECAPGAGFGWVLHGLWPQDENGGYPAYCQTTAADPSPRQTAAMADIMGTTGAAWYQWKKHGRCSGLSASQFLQDARRAYDAVKRPPAFRQLQKDVTLPAKLVERAFLQANPGMTAGEITVTCRSHRIQEVRICLTRGLALRPCGREVNRDCGLGDARLDSMR